MVPDKSLPSPLSSSLTPRSHISRHLRIAASTSLSSRAYPSMLPRPSSLLDELSSKISTLLHHSLLRPSPPKLSPKALTHTPKLQQTMRISKYSSSHLPVRRLPHTSPSYIPSNTHNPTNLSLHPSPRHLVASPSLRTMLDIPLVERYGTFSMDWSRLCMLLIGIKHERMFCLAQHG